MLVLEQVSNRCF